MLIDTLNLNQLRVFESVYRTRNMTRAAKELHLTQSGVSQHVKALEDALEVKLFDRVHLRLVPTEAAQALHERCFRAFHDLEKTLWQITKKSEGLEGRVVIGMPPEFGNQILIPLISTFLLKHPQVTLVVRQGLTSAMNGLILDGQVDFAFVDTFAMDGRIRTRQVYQQALELCVHADALKRLGPPVHRRSYYEKLDYIGYLEEEPLLRLWFGHHLKNRNLALKMRAVAADSQAIGRLIAAKVGAGVVPDSIADELERAGHKIFRFPGSGKPVWNAISLAYLKERTQSLVAMTTLEWLRTELGKLK